MTKLAKIEIQSEKGTQSVEMEVQNFEEYVPKVEKNYIFNSYIKDIIEDVKENQKVCLVGHTGCGKTSGIEQLAARINQGVLRVNLNGQLTVGDFIGTWTVKGGETVWVDGVLPKAMKEGLWLILDELDYGDAPILSVLNPILERNGKLTLKEKGHEIVVPHKNFRIFATANSIGCMQEFRHLYQGTNLMNEAFIDRFRIYKVDYLRPDLEIEIIKEILKDKMSKKHGFDSKVANTVFDKNKKIVNDMLKRMVDVANMVREQFEKGEIADTTFSTRRLIDWTEMTARHEHPIKAAQNSVFSKISKENREAIEGVMRKTLPNDSSIELIFKKLSGLVIYTIEEEKDALAEIYFKIKNDQIDEMVKNGTKTKEEAKALKEKVKAPEAQATLNNLISNVMQLAKEIRQLTDDNKIEFSFKTEHVMKYFEAILLNLADQRKTKGEKSDISINDAMIEAFDKELKSLMTTKDRSKFMATIDKYIEEKVK